MRKRNVILASLVVILTVSIVIYFVTRTERNSEIEIPVEIEAIEYNFPSLNITFVATGDVNYPIFGFEIFYEGQKVGNQTHTPIELLEKDNLHLHIQLSNEIPSGIPLIFNLLLGSETHPLHATFPITLP